MLWYILIQSKDMKAGHAMIRGVMLRRSMIRLITREQEPILCATVTSVLQKNLRIRDEVYEIDTVFQV